MTSSSPNNSDRKKTITKAIKSEDYYKVIRLLDDGYDIDEKDEEGRTALILCSFLTDEPKALALCRTLILGGADLYIKDMFGLMAIHYCCINQKVLLAGELLKSQDIINVKCEKLGNTELHYAVASGNFALAKLLIEFFSRFGYNTKVKNKKGLTPIQLAHQLGNDGIIELLDRSPSALERHVEKVTNACKRETKLLEFTLPNIHSASKARAQPMITRANIRSERSAYTPRPSTTSIISGKSSYASSLLCRPHTQSEQGYQLSTTLPGSKAPQLYRLSWRDTMRSVWNECQLQSTSSYRKPAIQLSDPRNDTSASDGGSCISRKTSVDRATFEACSSAKRRHTTFGVLQNSGRRMTIFYPGNGRDSHSRMDLLRTRRQSVAV